MIPLGYKPPVSKLLQEGGKQPPLQVLSFLEALNDAENSAPEINLMREELMKPAPNSALCILGHNGILLIIHGNMSIYSGTGCIDPQKGISVFAGILRGAGKTKTLRIHRGKSEKLIIPTGKGSKIYFEEEKKGDGGGKKF